MNIKAELLSVTLLLSILINLSLADGVDHCQEYEDFLTKTKCKSCSQGYGIKIENGVCEPCLVKDCLECPTNSMKCTKCYLRFFLNPDTGNCIKCSENCKTCSSSKCDICEENFFIDKANGKCKQYDQNCVKKGPNGCEKCKDRYFLNKDQQCEKDEACMSFNSQGGCNKCYQGYCVFSDTGRCGNCIDMCQKSHSSGQCELCEDGYFLNKESNICQRHHGVCIKKGQYGCLDCGLRYFITKSGVCGSCGSNCRYCSNAEECDVCEQDFFVTKIIKKCQKLDEKCLKGGPSGCKECMNGYFAHPETGICNNCASNCIKCKNAEQCEACEENFFVNPSSKTCLEYDENCISKGINGCEECTEEFFVDPESKFCKKHDENCVKKNKVGCQECKESYFANIKTGLCHDCTNDCMKCTNAEQCNLCKEDFFIEKSNMKCKQHDANCAKKGKNGCQGCNLEFFANLDTGLCDKCRENCKRCTNYEQCDFCQEGFFVNKANICEKQHADCLKKGRNGCQECKPQLFVNLKTGLCGKCAADCKRCNSAKDCIECESSWKSLQNDGTCSIKISYMIIFALLGLSLVVVALWLFKRNFKKTDPSKQELLRFEAGNTN